MHRLLLQGRQVLELGSGTGLPGMLAAAFGAHVIMTDLPEPLVIAALQAQLMLTSQMQPGPMPNVPLHIAWQLAAKIAGLLICAEASATQHPCKWPKYTSQWWLNQDLQPSMGDICS